MRHPEPSICVDVDVTNPGQYFACCALLELADRLWPGAEGWFESGDHAFVIACSGTLPELISAISTATLRQGDKSDTLSSPVIIGDPFIELTIDWWKTDLTGARDLKVWAGSMESYGIAYAMQNALRDEKFQSRSLFNIGMVVRVPGEAKQKKEPYYFDARRAPNSHSRDIGFAPNDLKLESIAHPAVELLCLIGLQVARPAFTERKRIYDYFTWKRPLPSSLLLAASTGQPLFSDSCGYRFENWFRTGQKKHKAFRPAVPLIKEPTL